MKKYLLLITLLTGCATTVPTEYQVVNSSRGDATVQMVAQAGKVSNPNNFTTTFYELDNTTALPKAKKECQTIGYQNGRFLSEYSRSPNPVNAPYLKEFTRNYACTGERKSVKW